MLFNQLPCSTARLTGLRSLGRVLAPAQPGLAHRIHTSAAAWKGKVITATEASFTDLVENRKGRVMVDFTAEWCGPCRSLKPVLKKHIEEQDNIDLVVLDIDAAVNVASKYKITALPTVKIFENGKEIDGFVGNQNYNFIKDFIAKHTAQSS
ncbi:hypothetical protein H4R33_000784 [Dimargaris cristalligena]|uniref:Thioredoxin-like protein n=1 Tax=Dimargaris cristalligena TaxID=215637 RepID=A0A4V1J4G0_9FUNG|nr:hypothetical protein H4R33_000784 [Dimargaris cristalligena]RKP35429.1 thioredoxin-like protein [Dimargaris cristalligena]|eukprot:RKP35429.1 thioredoxin-like protein [Dimargaris cristalligena]